MKSSDKRGKSKSIFMAETNNNNWELNDVENLIMIDILRNGDQSKL